jgi:hypothetical protein
MHGSGPYGIALFDALHTYLPALLYDSRRFTTVQSVLGYIRGQARQHLDLFSREQRNFVRGPATAANRPAGHGSPAAAESVVDALLRGLFSQQPITVPIEFTVPAGTAANATIFDLLNAPGFMNPVPVRATQEQIDTGSELLVAAGSEEGQICSICQDALRSAGDAQLRRLRHCRHTFHRACIDTWFTSHVQCPECRHDIREP